MQIKYKAIRYNSFRCSKCGKSFSLEEIKAFSTPCYGLLDVLDNLNHIKK